VPIESNRKRTTSEPRGLAEPSWLPPHLIPSIRNRLIVPRRPGIKGTPKPLNPLVRTGQQSDTHHFQPKTVEEGPVSDASPLNLEWRLVSSFRNWRSGL